jgi:hypothetical protein
MTREWALDRPAHDQRVGSRCTLRRCLVPAWLVVVFVHVGPAVTVVVDRAAVLEVLRGNPRGMSTGILACTNERYPKPRPSTGMRQQPKDTAEKDNTKQAHTQAHNHTHYSARHTLAGYRRARQSVPAECTPTWTG